MEENTQLIHEVSHLKASIDELHDEVVPLQKDNNWLFDEYQALKEEYDVVLLQLSKKEETIHIFQTIEHNVETNAKKNIDIVELIDSLVSSSTIAASPTVCENTVDVVEFPRSSISSSPPASICKNYFVNLCFETDKFVVSPSF